MFSEKVKEPKLSSELEAVIRRSIDEKNSANTDEIFRYKYKIMNLLTSDQDILHTLHCAKFGDDSVLNGDALRDVCIFSFMKLPDNKDEVNNYICFEVNDDCYGDYASKRIIFRTVSHINDCKTDWGIPRHDLLALIIKNKFDWSNECGLHLEKESDSGHVTDDGYYYREIVYVSTVPNNLFRRTNNFR